MPSVHNDILDAALDYVKTNGTRLCVCSAEPTTYAQAITDYKLADVDIDSADFTGPADGVVSGRRITINQQDAVPIDTTGSVVSMAIVDVTNTKLLYAVNTATTAVTAGATRVFEAFDIEIRDPTSA